VTIALPVTVVLAGKELEPPSEKFPEGLIRPTAKPVTPEAFGAGSEAANPTDTFTEELTTFIVPGERVRLAVRAGAVVSGVEARVIVVANPWLVISAVAQTRVLPATSEMMQFVMVQTPGSLNLGNVIGAVQFGVNPAVHSASTFTVVLTEFSLDGLVNVICHLEAPETSSDNVKFMFTDTGAAVVSIELDESVNAVIVGFIESTVVLTCRVPGLLGSGAKPNGPKKFKLNDVSNRRAYPTVHAPPGLNC
jgi:hypothetical protein